jgi:radical SAM superfamily enzyme YgiQ (UPF0313 family)
MNVFRPNKRPNQGYDFLKEDRPKNILLIAPTSPYVIGMSKWLSSNLGVERLAGYMRAKGHHAETYDVNIYRSIGTGQGKDELTLEEKLAETDWDIIGFSVYESTMPQDFANMELATKLCKRALIVAGGHAAQFDYQTLLDKSPTRIVVLGEGEFPLLALAAGEPWADIPGIVFKNLANPLTTEQFEEVTAAIDFENLPYETLWDSYVKMYLDAGHELTEDLLDTIHTARVYTRNYCPMRCKFCSSTNWLTYATGKSGVKLADLKADHLVDLLKRLIKAHPRLRTVYFTDDEFCIVRTQLIDFCNRVIEEKLPLTFICFTRVDDLDTEVVGLMAQAGFRTVNMGVESFSANVLREMHKQVIPEQIDEVLDALNSHGIRPSCSFILCTPDAKLDDIELTARRILKELAAERLYAGVNVTTQPQRGSSFYESHADFETQVIPLESSRMTLHRHHFIRCKDIETREFQYRFLTRWCAFLEEHVADSKEHWNSQRQSMHKLEMVLEVVDEVRSERGRPDQLRHLNLPQEERHRMWDLLEKFVYGASL